VVKLGATDAYCGRTEFCTVVCMICSYSSTSLNAQDTLLERRVFSKSAFSRVIVVWRMVRIWCFLPLDDTWWPDRGTGSRKGSELGNE
jgi:hypothetical protein